MAGRHLSSSRPATLSSFREGAERSSRVPVTCRQVIGAGHSSSIDEAGDRFVAVE